MTADKASAVRPIIGITCYEEDAKWGAWTTRAALLPVSYVRAVERAGGIPVLLPPQQLGAGEAERLASRLDGLVASGGPDVSPERYGEAPHERTSAASGERDGLELGVLGAAIDDELPTLAICRGLQVLNVARGGTLIQHLPDVVGHESHGGTAEGFGAHEVRVEPGTKLAGIVGWSEASVPTRHHQAIGVLGAGLKPTAHAADGTVEAVEDTGLPFLIGVQWHPEAGTDPSLFDALVAAARARREEQAGRAR